MDVPPPDYFAEEVRIIDGLVECGLQRPGISIDYVEDFQNVVVSIKGATKASAGHVECIRWAVGHAIIEFEDAQISSAYDTHVAEISRPRIEAETKSYLRERGLLGIAPTIENTTSLTELATAIERLCGFDAGTILTVSGDTLELGGDGRTLLDADYRRTGCLLALVRNSGVQKFGFVANEKLRSEDE